MRALRSLIAASALLLLSSCAFILGILGIDIKISGNIDVADGNPNGHTILVALATAIPGGGNVTFVTPPQSSGQGPNAFFEVDAEPGSYYVIAFLDTGDNSLNIDTDQYGCFPGCSGGPQSFEDPEFMGANITIAAGGGGGGGFTQLNMGVPLNDSVPGSGTREFQFTPISSGDHLVSMYGVGSDVAFAVFGDPGLLNELRFCDYESQTADERCYVPGLNSGQTYYLQVGDFGGGGTSFTVEVFGASPSLDGFEFNDTHGTRSSPSIGVGIHDLTLDANNDEDWLEIMLSPTMGTITVTTSARGSGFGNVDTVLELWDFAGAVMHTSNDDQPNSLFSQLTWSGAVAQVYVIRVRSFAGSDYGDYRLTISESL